MSDREALERLLQIALRKSAYGWCAGWREGVTAGQCACETENKEPCRRAVDRARQGLSTFLHSLPEGSTININDPAERRIRLASEVADAI